MPHATPISRPILPVLWLAVASLLLHALGAALHARTHEHPRIAFTEDPSDGVCSHAHAPPDRPDSHDSHDPDERDTCPTCLKFTADAKCGLHSAPNAPPLAAPLAFPRTLGAARTPQKPERTVPPARGPPLRVI